MPSAEVTSRSKEAKAQRRASESASRPGGSSGPTAKKLDHSNHCSNRQRCQPSEGTNSAPHGHAEVFRRAIPGPPRVRPGSDDRPCSTPTPPEYSRRASYSTGSIRRSWAGRKYWFAQGLKWDGRQTNACMIATNWEDPHGTPNDRARPERRPDRCCPTSSIRNLPSLAPGRRGNRTTAEPVPGRTSPSRWPRRATRGRRRRVPGTPSHRHHVEIDTRSAPWNSRRPTRQSFSSTRRMMF
jgi:hypothetical protein